VARLVEVAVWWVVLVLFWMATLSATSLAEWVVAGLAALPCALAATAARAVAGGGWRVSAGWSAWLVPLARVLLAETVRVFALAVRERTTRDAGASTARQMRRVPLPGGEAADRATGRRAVVTALLSATPGTMVVDSPPREPALLVHALDNRPSALERAVRD
jgi:multisubunit Na+/H+ antiporter MnhE subunit